MKTVGLFILGCCLSFISTDIIHAQSATITVGTIPTTVAGSSISVNWTVTNTGTSSRSFGVGAEIRKGSTVLADLGCQYTPTIAPNSTASGTFTYTIPANWSSGTYTARAAVWTSTCGSSTWLNSNDRDFVVQAQVTSATITVASIGTVVAGSSITVSYTVTNTGNYSRTFGVGAEIRQGSSVLADLGCQFTPTVAPNSTASGSFNYTIPSNWSGGTYTARAVVWTGTCGSSTNLNYYDRNFTVQAQVTSATITVASIGTVVAGHPITVSYTVTNTGNYSRTFGVGAEIRQSSTVLADLGCQFTPTISPNYTASGSFNYTIPINWLGGTYTARAVVWTGTCGSSTNLNYYDRNFTVQIAPLTISGRIAYHTYSSYLASPPPGDTIDGNAFLYSLDFQSLTNVTRSLPINNIMNPHFSPDGSKIVFMAIPQANPSTRQNLDIFVYDLAERQLTNLTLNVSIIDEDPKFSSDGSQILWKREGQIWRMNADGSSQTQLTSTSDEKSGPSHSPDATKIVYWSGSSSNADIWWMNANGTSPSAIITTSGIQEYYPIYRDANNILYARWESSTDQHDKIYNYNISSSTSSRLSVNQTGVEDADASHINANFLVFSSDRNGAGNYDIFVGRYDNGAVYTLSGANSNLKDLGPSYSPFTYARKLSLLAPLNDDSLGIGTSYTLRVRAFSDGGNWSSANSSVSFAGPSNQTYTNFQYEGNGIFSKVVTLPATIGSYLVTASAPSAEPGGTRTVSSIATPVTLRNTSSVEELPGTLPSNYHLNQNYPNPFNPVTTIEFSLPKQGFVELTVYDVLGVQVAILVKQQLGPGKYWTQWIPSENSSGVYFYQLRSTDFTDTKKSIFLR